MNGAELIAAERERQIRVEGWTPDHDDKYLDNELVLAAASYIEAATDIKNISDHGSALRRWPWKISWFKPNNDRARCLVKAAALIAAELDRMQRIRKPQSDMNKSGLREMTDMAKSDLNGTAHSLAYESCSRLLCDIGIADGLGFVIDVAELEEYELPAYLEAVAYLEARGLIQRDADKPGWLAVLEESEATAP